MNESNAEKNQGVNKVLIAAVLIAVAVGIGGAIAYVSRPAAPTVEPALPALAKGTIEITFKINDPIRFPDDEPLDDPQTVAWLEDSDGNYAGSILVSDWTSSEGWEETVKLPDKTKIKEMCPDWQAASGWPKKHSKKVIDAVTRATPATGPHKITVKCLDLKLNAGAYRYYVQTSVAPLHNILASGTLTLGDKAGESIADIAYKPELHKDAGKILSDVKARYTP